MPNPIRPGEVEIELDGETVTLKPTLNAARVLSKRFAGFTNLVAALGRMDLDAYVDVVTVGTGAEGKAAKAVPDQVYAVGMIDLMAPLTNFVTNLANGGKPVDPAKDKDDTEGGTKNAV